MKTEPTITRGKKGRIECAVTFSEAEVAPARDAALLALGKNVKVPGFRPGKVPVEMLLEKVSPEELFERTIRNLLPEVLEKIVTEHEIKPIVAPKVELVSSEPAAVKVVFFEAPEISLKGIDTIRIDKKELKADKKDIDRMVEYILKQHQKTSVVDRSAKEGDRITMDFHGEDEQGKEIENTRSQDYKVIIGSKTLIPGFEEALVGLKAGESKSFTVTFPEKYQAEHLRNTKAVFHVKATLVEEVTLPALDDAFVKEHLREESAESFLKALESSMLKQEEEIERRRREGALLDAIRDAVQADFADEVIEDEAGDMLKEFGEQLQEQNISIEQWLEQTGKDAKGFADDMKQKAIGRLKLRYGMQALVEKNAAEIAEEEMLSVISEHLAPLSQEEREKALPDYAKGRHAYERLLWQKKVERLLDEFLSR